MYPKPQKTIYFFRHAQGEGNIQRLKSTDEDIHLPEQHLTELGIEQVKKLAPRVSTLNLEVLISSTMTRARETTEIVNQNHNYKIEYSDLFIERRKPSSIIGKLRNDELVSATEKAWQHTLFTSNQQVEDGDSYDTLIQRSKQCLSFLKARKEQTIGVITHEFFLNTIIAQATLGETINPIVYQRYQEQHWLENTGMVVLHYHPEYPYTGWILWTYNDHSHLDNIKR